MNKRIIFAVALSILIIALMLWVSNPGEFADKVIGINIFYLLIVIGLYFANVFTKAIRWYFLVNSTGTKVPFRKTFPFFMIGLALNNLTPGKIAGEPARAYLLKKEADVPIGHGLASIMAEKILDITVIATMAVIGAVFILPLLKPNEARILIVLLVLIIAGIITVIVLLKNSKILKKLVDGSVNFGTKVSNGEFTTKWSSAFIGFTDKFTLGANSILKAKKAAAGCMILTVIIWINEAIRLFIILLAIPDSGSFSLGAVFIASSVANIVGILLPLGSGNLLGIGAVFIAVGMDPAVVSLSGILHVATSIWISVPLGVIAILITGFKLTKMSKKV